MHHVGIFQNIPNKVFSTSKYSLLIYLGIVSKLQEVLCQYFTKPSLSQLQSVREMKDRHLQNVHFGFLPLKVAKCHRYGRYICVKILKDLISVFFWTICNSVPFCHRCTDATDVKEECKNAWWTRIPNEWKTICFCVYDIIFEFDCGRPWIIHSTDIILLHLRVLTASSRAVIRAW